MNRVKEKKKIVWDKQGVYDLIQLSRVGLKYNHAMFLIASCFWEALMNIFHLPFGMVTATLFDVAANAGLQPTMADYEPAKTYSGFEANNAFSTFIEEHYSS